MEPRMKKSQQEAQEFSTEEECWVTASVVLYNNEKELPLLLASIAQEIIDLKQYFHLYVVDNSTTGRSRNRRACLDYDFVTFVESAENKGFGAGHNQIIRQLTSSYHFVINPDITFPGGVINALVGYLENHADTVIATCEVKYPNGDIQNLPKKRPSFKYLLGRRFSGIFKTDFFLSPAREYSMESEIEKRILEIEFCTGCFFIARTDLLKKLDGFDESYFMYFEDADLTQRALEYGKVVLCRDCHVVHDWKGGSRKSLKLLTYHLFSMFRFFRKYGWR